MARHTTAYLQTPASSALTACCTAPPMLTVSTCTCQLRFGSLSMAITSGMVASTLWVKALPLTGRAG